MTCTGKRKSNSGRVGNCELTYEHVIDCDGCDRFEADPWRFCGICGGEAENDDNLHILTCTADRTHLSANWDVVWFKMPKKGV